MYIFRRVIAMPKSPALHTKNNHYNSSMKAWTIGSCLYLYNLMDNRLSQNIDDTPKSDSATPVTYSHHHEKWNPNITYYERNQQQITHSYIEALIFLCLYYCPLNYCISYYLLSLKSAHPSKPLCKLRVSILKQRGFHQIS